MGAKSRRKGAKGELTVSRILSAWWVGDTTLLKAKATDLPIRRTPLSGGWAKGSGLGGDLVSVKPEASSFGIFCVEVKNQERWQLEGMLKDKKWPVHGWWRQCRTESKNAHAIPLLVFTRNQHPWYFRMRKSQFNILCADRRAELVRENFIFHKGSVYGLLDTFISTFSPGDCLRAFHAKVTFGGAGKRNIR